MAKNVKINGVDYSNVASVKLPLTADPQTFAYYYDTDSGDATAGDILSGKKAWVDGAEVTGTIASKTSADLTVSGKTVTVPAGHYASGGSKAIADAVVLPGLTVTSDYTTTTATDYPIEILPEAEVFQAGYIGSFVSGASHTTYINTETKSATPTTSSQTITPSAHKLLSSVTVNAVSLTGNAAVGDVLAGKTFYNTSLTKATGTLTVPALSLTSGVLTIS